jgi:hypothetical protein
MMKNDNILYQLTVPSDQISNGMEYYIKVADKKGKTFYWPEEGSGAPIRIAVTDDHDPPEVEIDRVFNAPVRQPFKVSVKVEDRAGVKWVRLRYRHVTQFEDYQLVEMTYNIESGKYEGIIPGHFLIPEWDLMYFIECMDAHGNGCMYPDLENEAPYIIVGLER